MGTQPPPPSPTAEPAMAGDRALHTAINVDVREPLFFGGGDQGCLPELERIETFARTSITESTVSDAAQACVSLIHQMAICRYVQFS